MIVKLRKTATIFFASYVLFFSLGAGITEHFCGEILSNISLTATEKPCCDDDAPMSCCHSETTFLTFSEQAYFQFFNFSVDPSFVSVLTDIPVWLEGKWSVELLTNNFSIKEAPPLFERTDFHSIYQVYLI